MYCCAVLNKGQSKPSKRSIQNRQLIVQARYNFLTKKTNKQTNKRWEGMPYSDNILVTHLANNILPLHLSTSLRQHSFSTSFVGFFVVGCGFCFVLFCLIVLFFFWLQFIMRKFWRGKKKKYLTLPLYKILEIGHTIQAVPAPNISFTLFSSKAAVRSLMVMYRSDTLNSPCTRRIKQKL